MCSFPAVTQRGATVFSESLSAFNRFGILLAADDPNPFGGIMNMLPFFLAVGFLFYFMIIRPQKREKKRRESLLQALKKNDRVVTIGGIIGVVTSVSAEGKEVSLKIDEATNAKLRVLRSSIHEVLKDDSADEASSK